MKTYKHFGSYSSGLPKFGNCVEQFGRVPQVVVCNPASEAEVRKAVEDYFARVKPLVPTASPEITTNAGCLTWEIWFLIN